MFQRYLRDKDDKFKVIGISIVEPKELEDGKTVISVKMKVGSSENPINITSLLDPIKDTILN
ncbi:hypothetical protein [Bacillus pinisoli]|uniref:hypothetical protein n=1 Tax=Bacillus pinisoli TaxID=2901866 RepID=UPI001FF1D861|nr:hypothetical protein [Bacillus pinisoli]